VIPPGETLHDGDPRHGTAGGYTNWGCRCPDCTRAATGEQRRLKANRFARLAVDPSQAPHGKASTYGNWGCRCRPCTDAWTAPSVDAGRRR